ncbi:MAG: thiamine-binding protein, partial [Crocinitomicaceae bacterium]
NNLIMNAAIQVVPLEKSAVAMEIVDRSIEVIQKSGLNYTVSAFETSVDGTWDEIISLLSNLKSQLNNENVEDALINVKFQISNGRSVVGEDKTKKFI